MDPAVIDFCDQLCFIGLITKEILW